MLELIKRETFPEYDWSVMQETCLERESGWIKKAERNRKKSFYY